MSENEVPIWQRRIADRSSALFWLFMGLALGAFLAVSFYQFNPDAVGLKFLAAMIGPGLGALGGFSAGLVLERVRIRTARSVPVTELRLELASIRDMLEAFLVTISIEQKGQLHVSPIDSAANITKIIARHADMLQPRTVLDFDVNREIATWGGTILFWCDVIQGGFVEGARRSTAPDRWERAESFIADAIKVVDDADAFLQRALDR